MSATATVTVQGVITGAPQGVMYVGPLNVSSANANASVQQIVLASGANTITVPATPATTGCIIELPATNTQATTLKGVTGDTGVPIGLTGSIMLSWSSASPPTSFVLTSAAAQTGLVTTITFF
ncbi:MAG: hypothetical protein KGI71_04130 [Patescibacteria group bacterium]|nr:hypothetical protein [Patescibacteria group bacterium]